MEFQLCESIPEVGPSGLQCLLRELCRDSPTSQDCYRSHSHCLRGLWYNIKDCSMEGAACTIQNLGAIEENTHQVWLFRN